MCPGRGVFASKDIVRNTVVEVSSVIVLPIGDVEAIKETRLNDYT